MISGSSILTVRPQCSVQCPTPGRWNRMHYSCLRGAGFEVSVCIMKAERIRIVMLYGSLVFSFSFCLFFSHSPPLFSFLSLFLSLTLFNSILFYSFFFLCTFALLHHSPTQTRLHTRTPSHLVLLVYYVYVSICRALWLIETGAVKRPHTRSRSQCLTTCRLWFDGLLPELASPWRGSALGFPVNEALCGWEG